MRFVAASPYSLHRTPSRRHPGVRTMTQARDGRVSRGPMACAIHWDALKKMLSARTPTVLVDPYRKGVNGEATISPAGMTSGEVCDFLKQ